MTDRRENYDVVILGGGPSGISAAVWCADLGLQPLLIERNERLGGQLWWIYNPITNYLGVNAKNGSEMAQRFEEHARSAAVEILTGQEVRAVDLSERTVCCGDTKFRGKAMILATGVRRSRLAVPGEDMRVGILTSGARDRGTVAGKTVVIVGGGDAALENALILSEHADQIIVVHRRDEFKARREFVEKARQRSNVRFAMESSVTRIGGSEQVDSVEVEGPAGSELLRCDAVLIRIGVEPNTELFRGQIELDGRAYVVAAPEMRTSRPGVWAVGDVTGPSAMTITGSVGQGSAAAASVLRFLSAAAT